MHMLVLRKDFDIKKAIQKKTFQNRQLEPDAPSVWLAPIQLIPA